ncbi:hypothetical protein Tco_1059501 [Tanacetum coccineum]
MGLPFSCWGEGNQNLIYGRVHIHTSINKGLIKEELKVSVKGKVYEVRVVEEIRDITMIGIQDDIVKKDDKRYMKEENDMEVDEEEWYRRGSKKKRKALGDTKFEGIEMGMVFNQGKVNGEKVVNKTKIGRRSVTKAKEAAWKILKEIGELIGISWVLAEEEKNREMQGHQGNVAKGIEVQHAQ